MPIPRPLWAALRETSGQPLPTREPKAALLAMHPELRGLDVHELAGALGVREDEAERIVSTFLRESVPADVLPTAEEARGLSLDARIVLVGRPAPPSYLARGSVERSGLSGDAGGIGDVYTYTSAPLPLGFFYRLPSRAVTDSKGTLLEIGAPSSYDAQCATILRADIPQDPNDPTLPHPDCIRAFCFAMGIGLATPVPFQPGGLPASYTGEYGTQAFLTPGAAAVVEDVGSWPAPQAGEVFPIDEVRRAFDAFRWYGPLSGDNETKPGAVSWSWSSDDYVTRERYVFWYQLDDGGAWNKCVQVQGWASQANGWILPSKFGEKIRSWAWRPTDSQFVGEWRSFWSWDKWTNENKSTIAVVAVWVASIAGTIATLGAGAGAIAGAAAFTVVMQAGLKLYNAIGAGDPSKAIAACVEIGAAVNGVSDGGSFVDAMAKNNPGLAHFAESVAAPFQKIYAAAGGVAGDVVGLWNQAQALKSQVPKVVPATWLSAFSAFGANTGAVSGASAWLQMARLPSSAGVAAELWANAPQWAQDMVALGLALSSAEQAQSFSVARSVMFAPQSVHGGGQMMMQVSPAQAAMTRAIWDNVPPAPSPTPMPSLVANTASPSASGGGGGVVVLAVAALAGLFLLRKK